MISSILSLDPISRSPYRLCLAAGLLFAALPPAVWCQAPEFFGTYANVDGKLAPLIGGKGTFTPGQTNLQVYDFQKMSLQAETVFIFEGGDIRFTVFDAAVADASASVELYKMPYARSLITRPDASAPIVGMLDQMSGEAERVSPKAPPQLLSKNLWLRRRMR